MAKMTLEQWMYRGDERRAAYQGKEIEYVVDYVGEVYDGNWRVMFVGEDNWVMLPDKYVMVDVEEGPEIGNSDEYAFHGDLIEDDEADRLARETHALEMLEADAMASDSYVCDYCGDNIGDSPFNRCPTCGAGGLEGGGQEDEQQPDASEDPIELDFDKLVEDGLLVAGLACPHCGWNMAEEPAPGEDKEGQAWGVIDGQTIDEVAVRRLIRQKMDALEKLRVTQFALNHAIQTITRLEKELVGCTVSVFSMTPKGYDALREMCYDDGQPSVGA